MGTIIAVVNQKGGVGKTTTAVNLTAALTALGSRVLLCDFDPQANATSGLGVEKRSVVLGAYEMLIDNALPERCVVRTRYGSLIPSSASLAGATVELIGLENREYRLKDQLDRLRDSYDYILIDCPPSLELLTINALCAADSILIPVQCEYYALEGLSDLMATMRAIKKRLNPRLQIFGVLLTMFDGRTNFSNQVAQEVRRHFPGKVFASVIPRNVRLAEAPSHGSRLSRGRGRIPQKGVSYEAKRLGARTRRSDRRFFRELAAAAGGHDAAPAKGRAEPQSAAPRVRRGRTAGARGLDRGARHRAAARRPRAG